MVRKNTMNGRHPKRQDCSLQTTRGNCERGRDNDGIRNVMKQYYARIIVNRLAGNGATICFFFFFTVGPAPLADFASPAPSRRAYFPARGPTMLHTTHTLSLFTLHYSSTS